MYTCLKNSEQSILDVFTNELVELLIIVSL